MWCKFFPALLFLLKRFITRVLNVCYNLVNHIDISENKDKIVNG